MPSSNIISEYQLANLGSNGTRVERSKRFEAGRRKNSLSLSRVTRMNPRCERSSNRPWNIDWPRCVAFEPGLRSRGVASKTERAKRERALYAATTFYPARNWLNEWPSMLDEGE